LKSSPLIRKLGRLYHSKKALAIPVTYLILFVTTLFLVAVTYDLAIQRIDANSQDLKVSTAQGNMMGLDEDLSSVLWQPGSSQTLDFTDSGGQLNIEPTSNPLSISITDNNISAIVFNDSVGWVVYELPYSETADTGLFLRGDERAIVNQSGFSMTQLCIQEGAENSEILLRYRPIVSCVAAETQDNETVNDVRIYVIDLNSSQLIENVTGDVPLKITCESTETSVTNYTIPYQPGTLIVTANFEDMNGQVSVPIVPISSTSYGAIVNVELVLCEVQIERWVM